MGGLNNTIYIYIYVYVFYINRYYLFPILFVIYSKNPIFSFHALSIRDKAFSFSNHIIPYPWYSVYQYEFAFFLILLSCLYFLDKKLF